MTAATGLRQRLYGVAQRAYGASLRTRYGKGGMPWRVHDRILRVDPSVRHLVPHEPETALYEFVRTTLKPGAHVLDVGSFLGIYALLEAGLAGPAGRVVTVEPTAWSAAIARRHLRYNAADAAAVILVEAAAGAAPGEATLHEYDLPYVNALTQAPDGVGTPRLRRVQVRTLDEICAAHGLAPTFIRLDVQGAEWQALEGARQMIAAAGDRLTIVAEMHPQCWPAFGIDAGGARATIASLGLRAAPLEPGAGLFGRDAHIVLTPLARA